jgi:hypothetical protein
LHKLQNMCKIYFERSKNLVKLAAVQPKNAWRASYEKYYQKNCKHISTELERMGNFHFPNSWSQY